MMFLYPLLGYMLLPAGISILTQTFSFYGFGVVIITFWSLLPGVKGGFF